LRVAGSHVNLFYFGEREGGLGENKIAGIQGLSAKAREYGEKRGLKDLCKGGGKKREGEGVRAEGKL
jgi:hypothetical protein